MKVEKQLKRKVVPKYSKTTLRLQNSLRKIRRARRTFLKEKARILIVRFFKMVTKQVIIPFSIVRYIDEVKYHVVLMQVGCLLLERP